MIKPIELVRYLRRACLEILERGTVDENRRYPLRLGQQQGYEATIRYFDRNELSDNEKLEGFYKMTVGLGKTGFYEALIDRVIAYTQRDGLDFRVGIVAPKIELLEQIQSEFIKFFPALEGKIGIHGGFWPSTKTRRREIDKPITAISFPSWDMQVDQGLMSDSNVDMLITDEGHRGTSPAREERLVKHFARAARFAFMATPHFSETKSVLNTHKREIFSKGLVESVRDGESAAYIRAQHHVIRVSPSTLEPETDRTRAKQRAFIDFVATLSLTGSDMAGTVLGYDEVTGDRLTDNQIGIYTGDTAHADACAELLNNMPELQRLAGDHGAERFAVSIHTNEIDTKQQKFLKAAYERGQRRALCGDELFKEGYNYEPMKVVIVYPTSSKVDLEQIVGRGARQYWNDIKKRSEGLTAISTSIYIGVDPTDPGDPEDVARARAADSLERARSLVASVSAVDILDGNVEIFGPSVKPRQILNKGVVSGSRVGFGHIEITSYTTVDAVRTIHAERAAELAAFREEEICIENWSQSPEYVKLIALRIRKGNIGGRRIFRLAGNDQVVQNTFGSVAILDSILWGQIETVPLRRVQALTQIISDQPDAITNWPKSEEYKLLQELRVRKGGLGHRVLYRLLEKEDSTNDFPNSSDIDAVVNGRLSYVAAYLYEALMSVLAHQPDAIVNWSNSPEFVQLAALRKRKGNFGYKVLYSLLQRDESFKDVFEAPHRVATIISGKKTVVAVAEINILMQFLAGQSDAIFDWPQSAEYKSLLALRKQKGNIGASNLFKLCQENIGSGPLFETHNAIGNILQGLVDVVTRMELQTLSLILGALPDMISDWPKSIELNTLRELWRRLGSIPYKALYSKTSELADAQGLFASEHAIKGIFRGTTEKVSRRQLDVLTQALESSQSAPENSQTSTKTDEKVNGSTKPSISTKTTTSAERPRSSGRTRSPSRSAPRS